MAVDFAYKRRLRHGKGAALRNLKLRMSRKLLFVSALITCLGFEMGLVLHEKGDPMEELVQRLRNFIRKTPLDILAAVFVALHERVDGPANKAKVLRVAQDVFEAYDELMRHLDDGDLRKRLDELKPDEMDEDRIFQHLRKVSHRFRDGLLQLFFELDEKLSRLTKFYGVF